MLSFYQFLIERAGGAAAGKLDMATLPASKAAQYALQTLGEERFAELKSFSNNYREAQKLCRLGWAKRKDMPVITTPDVSEFKNKLQQGEFPEVGKVKVDFRRLAVGNLKPIQKQIYFDKAIAILSNGTTESTKNFLLSHTIYVISSDNYIIDGHHRFAATMLMDPRLAVQTISIDLPISVLLPLALAYGDSIGNQRNK